MKILYHHRIASKDGQYVHIEELTTALKRRGHEIIMVGPRIVERGSFGSDGGIVAKMKKYLPGFIYELAEFGYSINAFIKLLYTVMRYRPDCLYERYNLYLLSGVWVKRLFGLPMLLEVNAPLFLERSRYGRIALPIMARWSECAAWTGADRVLPVTGVLAGMVRSCGVPEGNISVIHNGIDLARFSSVEDNSELRGELGLEGKTVLGFSGFVREWHGLERVVDLLVPEAGRPERHLLLVGDGPARELIENRARKLDVESSITITGIVDRDRVSEYINCFDIALQPDVVGYASPLKLFEYMASGRAIVAPDVPNIREILRHDFNAVLFDPSRKDGFTAAVEQLCDSETKRRKLGEAARNTIIDLDYTWDANAGRVEKMFRDLLDR